MPESAIFPRMYFLTDNRAGLRNEAVCARPEIPPKDKNCIIKRYVIKSVV